MKTLGMKTVEDKKHEILAKRIVKCLGEDFVLSSVVHEIFGCSVYVEHCGVVWLTGDSDDGNLEEACGDLAEGYFIFGKGVSDSVFYGNIYSGHLHNLVSRSVSELEMKLALNGVW